MTNESIFGILFDHPSPMFKKQKVRTFCVHDFLVLDLYMHARQSIHFITLTTRIIIKSEGVSVGSESGVVKLVQFMVSETTFTK